MEKERVPGGWGKQMREWKGEEEWIPSLSIRIQTSRRVVKLIETSPSLGGQKTFGETLMFCYLVHQLLCVTDYLERFTNCSRIIFKISYIAIWCQWQWCQIGPFSISNHQKSPRWTGRELPALAASLRRCLFHDLYAASVRMYQVA